MPSTKILNMKGHVFSCLLLYMLLRNIAQELNVDNDASLATMRALLGRHGVVKIVRDEKGATTAVKAVIHVNGSLMRKNPQVEDGRW